LFNEEKRERIGWEKWKQLTNGKETEDGKEGMQRPLRNVCRSGSKKLRCDVNYRKANASCIGCFIEEITRLLSPKYKCFILVHNS
jgi:hypothetical protein